MNVKLLAFSVMLIDHGFCHGMIYINDNVQKQHAKITHKTTSLLLISNIQSVNLDLSVVWEDLENKTRHKKISA